MRHPIDQSSMRLCQWQGATTSRRRAYQKASALSLRTFSVSLGASAELPLVCRLLLAARKLLRQSRTLSLECLTLLFLPLAPFLLPLRV